MAKRPMIRIHNLETDTIEDREMNDQEFADFQEIQSKYGTLLNEK